jgi:hypothetical protein
MNRRGFLKGLMGMAAAVMMPLSVTEFGSPLPPVEEKLPEGMFYMSEQTLCAYEMPITRIIENNSIKDIQEIEDREFLKHIEEASNGTYASTNTRAHRVVGS